MGWVCGRGCFGLRSSINIKGDLSLDGINCLAVAVVGLIELGKEELNKVRKGGNMRDGNDDLVVALIK